MPKVNMRRMLLATLLAGTGMWVVAGIWHQLIMVRMYDELHASHEGVGLLLLAYFILAAFMSYLYVRMYAGGSPWRQGLKLGVLVGILWVFPHGLAMAGAHDESLDYVFRNTAWHVVEQGMGGIMLAYVIEYRSGHR